MARLLKQAEMDKIAMLRQADTEGRKQAHVDSVMQLAKTAARIQAWARMMQKDASITLGKAGVKAVLGKGTQAAATATSTAARSGPGFKRLAISPTGRVSRTPVSGAVPQPVAPPAGAPVPMRPVPAAPGTQPTPGRLSPPPGQQRILPWQGVQAPMVKTESAGMDKAAFPVPGAGRIVKAVAGRLGATATPVAERVLAGTLAKPTAGMVGANVAKAAPSKLVGGKRIGALKPVSGADVAARAGVAPAAPPTGGMGGQRLRIQGGQATPMSWSTPGQAGPVVRRRAAAGAAGQAAPAPTPPVVAGQSPRSVGEVLNFKPSGGALEAAPAPISKAQQKMLSKAGVPEEALQKPMTPEFTGGTAAAPAAAPAAAAPPAAPPKPGLQPPAEAGHYGGATSQPTVVHGRAGQLGAPVASAEAPAAALQEAQIARESAQAGLQPAPGARRAAPTARGEGAGPVNRTRAQREAVEAARTPAERAALAEQQTAKSFSRAKELERIPLEQRTPEQVAELSGLKGQKDVADLYGKEARGAQKRKLKWGLMAGVGLPAAALGYGALKAAPAVAGALQQSTMYPMAGAYGWSPVDYGYGSSPYGPGAMNLGRGG